MDSEKALLRRIRRHVRGPERDFFAATSPGLESLCLEELGDLSLGTGEGRAVPGGVAFRGRIQDCYAANLHLRTANRILMRIDTFRASNFRQLEKRLSGFGWELYFASGPAPQVRVVAKRSRLYHGGAIADCVSRSINERSQRIDFVKVPGVASSSVQQIYVRVEDDRFTLSVDSSGEILHKRGLKKHAARAPIRETIAAAVLRLAGYSVTDPLIDPMCGSGTFSLEAAMAAKNVPAGWFRNFAFMGWPVFSQDQWEYMKREAGASMAKADQPRIFASDVDEEACGILGECTARHGLSDIVRVSSVDFFDLKPVELTDKSGLIVINPPYGRRVNTRKESSRLFAEICDRLARDYKGWKLALMVPTKRLAKTVPLRLRAHPLLHGGLRLTLLEGRIA